MDRKATIKDIAKQANVSFKTVSRVINGESGVKEETRQKVKEVLDRCNYTANYFAKNLRKKNNKTIIISTKKEEGLFLNQWSGIVLKNIIDEAKKYDYEVLIDNFQNNKVNKNIIESGYIDGVIIFDAFDDDIRIKECNKLKIPLVIVGKHSKETYVTCDNFGGAYQAADYLFKKGYSDICFILGPVKAATNFDRISGYKKAHYDNKILLNEERIFSGISGYDKIYSLVKNIINNHVAPDAFFISGDERVVGVLKALKEKGIKIPEDVGIIGFDDIPLAEYLEPELTTVRQYLECIGKSVFVKLLDKIEGREVESLEIPIELIIRNSVK